MANKKHLALLNQGVVAWNKWRAREAVPLARVCMIEKGSRDASLAHYGFTRKERVYASAPSKERIGLHTVPIKYAAPSDLRVRLDLIGADLNGTDLRGVNFSGVLLNEANLEKADLSDADLSETDLYGADLSGAKLLRVNLMYAHLVNVRMSNAILADSYVYGVSAWDAELSGSVQSNLIITRAEPRITVDDLKVAQLIHLVLSHHGLREIIEAMATKVVLILGRFTPKRKRVLEAARIALKDRGFVPVLFDFPGPESRDLTETLSVLAHLARFVLVDLTGPRSVPHELIRIVPALPSVPVQPLLHRDERVYGMFAHLARFPWVLEPITYNAPDDLSQLIPGILTRVEEVLTNGK